MIVDGCTHTYEQLTASVLPAHMRRLRESLASPWECSRFAQSGQGPVSIARDLGLRGDFGGSYVLLEAGSPLYVGISRTVLSRVRQHLTGATHYDASLPYLMAQRRVPKSGIRDEVMKNDDFRAAFEAEQRRLRTCRVAMVQIDNAVERHIFEVYAAIELGTGEWNSFDTH